MATVVHPPRLAPLYGLILALLPVYAALQEYWWRFPPFLLLAFLYALCVPVYYALREYYQELDTRGHEGGHGLGRAAHLVLVAIFALACFGAWPLLQTFAIGHLQLPLPRRVTHGAVQDLLWYVLGLLLFLAVYWLAHRFPGVRFTFHLRWRWSWWDAIIIAAFGILTVLGLHVYMTYFSASHGPMEVFGTGADTAPLLYWAGGIGFALANALCEELWFRGVLLGALRPLLPATRAIVLQAVVFGLFHWFGTPQGVLGVLLSGVWGALLAWWVWRRGSLWPAVVVHFIADILIFAATNR